MIKTKNLLLPNISILNVLRKDGDDDRVYGYVMNKTDLGVQAHQCSTFGS
jgi:hypothetical protein